MIRAYWGMHIKLIQSNSCPDEKEALCLNYWMDDRHSRKNSDVFYKLQAMCVFPWRKLDTEISVNNSTFPLIILFIAFFFRCIHYAELVEWYQKTYWTMNAAFNSHFVYKSYFCQVVPLSNSRTNVKISNKTSLLLIYIRGITIFISFQRYYLMKIYDEHKGTSFVK